MKFNSIQFLVFFPIVASAFFVIPNRWRWLLLLGASYVFYASWNLKYIVVLLTMTAVEYASGRMIERQASSTRRRVILIVSLLASLGILFFFKYFDLSNRALSNAFDLLGVAHLLPEMHLLLPLGISYYTLQTISYVLDVAVA